MSLSPPSRTSTAPVSPAKPSALQVIPPTRHTASSVCYHQGGDCGVSGPGPADWRTASSIRLSGSWTPSRPCPPPPLLPHTTLNSNTTTPPPSSPHPQDLTTPPPPPPLTNCDPHQSLCAALDWSLPHLALTVNYLFWQSDKRLFFFCTTHISAQFCFNWFALYLPCALCHFIYLFFIFLQCPHLYICIVCMYICLNCIYLYLNVYCQCLMLTVCTQGLRVTQFQFSVCMYCTCGRIDNKADLTNIILGNTVV